MAVILCSGAGLLIKNLRGLSDTPAGFSEDHVLFADVSPSLEFCKKHDGCLEFYRNLQDRVAALPGVKSAAYTEEVPMESFPGAPIVAQDRPEMSSAPHVAWYFLISPGYFKTMEIPLLAGRDFNPSDRQITIISRDAAK